MVRGVCIPRIGSIKKGVTDYTELMSYNYVLIDVEDVSEDPESSMEECQSVTFFNQYSKPKYPLLY